ncbi:MAG: hypothetical protein GF408_00945 [Candidatus Omnitrophica bacterium]|nr:hypothetical protein [Candidatus Omnitrophota bacterium]
MKNIKNILVICTGNSCRSIMAEAYMKKRLAEEGLDINVFSAGTLGVDGMKPPQETVKMLESIDVDPSGYESTALSAALANKADLILVMEPHHAESVKDISPENAHKTVYLKEFDREPGDISIPDPIGRPLAFYRVSFGIIKNSVEGLVEWLKK